jgi:SAM-dependent methyltransferase
MGWQSGEAWDERYRAGKYRFLRDAVERARLDRIARLIADIAARDGACEVVDIGCGEGLLLEAIGGLPITRYIGVDLSAVALSRLPRSDIETLAICKPFGQWDGRPEASAPRVYVASEVLYYAPDAGKALQRIVGGGPAHVIVSCVAGEAGKPNWTAASRALWRELAATGWAKERAAQVRQGGHVWDIVQYRA